jgi:MFS family permease
MGIYIIFLYCGNSLGPLVSGFIIEGKISLSGPSRTHQAHIILGPGWRWFSWLCAIIAGLNFLAIFFFVHETRFDRMINDASFVHEAGVSEKKSFSPTIEKIQSTTGSDSQGGTKKTLLQNLSLWSGTSEQSYISHFLRPFLLVAYPAVAWGILACK